MAEVLGDGAGKERALGIWSDRINKKQLDDKNVGVGLRVRDYEGRDLYSSGASEGMNCLTSQTQEQTPFVRAEGVRDDICCVQYLYVFVCLCGLCVSPNIYCHNDVWLLGEQGFHSREKRGWADNRLGLPLFLCLNTRQIHIHAPNMHTVVHISVFVYLGCIH